MQLLHYSLVCSFFNVTRLLFFWKCYLLKFYQNYKIYQQIVWLLTSSTKKKFSPQCWCSRLSFFHWSILFCQKAELFNHFTKLHLCSQWLSTIHRMSICYAKDFASLLLYTGSALLSRAKWPLWQHASGVYNGYSTALQKLCLSGWSSHTERPRFKQLPKLRRICH